MKIDEFITLFEEWCNKTNNADDFTVGKNMQINTKLTVDEGGFIWIRENELFKRVKTTVSVDDISEFRLLGYDEECFYIICSDNSEFEVRKNECYYCIDGKPSGWGSAVEHFEKFPDGIVQS